MSYESVISPDRLTYICEYIPEYIKDIEGDIVEIGVYKGGSLARIADLFPKRTIFGIDSFEGLPEISIEDDGTNHEAGDFKDVNFNEMRQWFSENKKNVILIKGMFPNNGTLTRLKKRKLAFIHVDVDLYKGVLDCCIHLYPKLSAGGIMIFDDYGFEQCPGAKKAVDRYFSDKKYCIKRELPTKQFFVCNYYG